MHLIIQRFFLVSLLFLAMFSSSCTPGKGKARAGTIFYKVDYPKQKNNAFLYNILPKETDIIFRDGVLRHNISQANLFNILLIDCKHQKLDLYHQYGDDGYNVKLNSSELSALKSDLPDFEIKFLSDTRIIAGLEAKKAIAISKKEPTKKIDLWYTEELDVPNPNWYNPYHQVPGILLEYSIEQFGITMNYKAYKVKKENTTARTEALTIPVKGSLISYSEYSDKMYHLFQSFK